MKELSKKQKIHLEELAKSNKDKTRSEEFKQYQSTLKSGVLHSESHKKNISLAKQQSVIQLDSNRKVKRVFNSLAEAAKFMRCSDSSISLAITKKKFCLGYYWEKSKANERLSDLIEIKEVLGYREIVITKEELKTIDKETREKYLLLFLSYIKRVSPEFPKFQSEESLQEVLVGIQKFDFSRIYNENTRTFKNATSSIGISYLKEVFDNYWDCSYHNSKSPKEYWRDTLLMKAVLKYRLGLNSSNEYFDLSLHQLVMGIAAARHTISFFKPLVAACIYKHFLQDKVNPIVIDPCAGFGGRLLGFKSIYPEGTYIGLEPNKQSYTNLVKLSQNFSNVNLFNCKLEDYTGNKDCDLTFTSIPYYDLEEYNNDFRYESLEQWRDTFINSLLTYKNLLVNLPEKLQKQLDLKYKEKYYLENITSHFNKKEKTKQEFILKINDNFL